MAAVRVPPSACSTSQSMRIEFSPRADRSIAARSERPMRREISCVRPPILPLDRLAVVPGQRGARQHRVLRRDPAEAAALAPARHALLHRGRAEHLGVAEADQRRPLGVLLPVPLDGDGTELIVGAGVGTWHGTEGIEASGHGCAGRMDACAPTPSTSAPAAAPASTTSPATAPRSCPVRATGCSTSSSRTPPPGSRSSRPAPAATTTCCAPSTTCCRATAGGGTRTAAPGTAATTCCRRSSRRRSSCPSSTASCSWAPGSRSAWSTPTSTTAPATVRLSFLAG